MKESQDYHEDFEVLEINNNNNKFISEISYNIPKIVYLNFSQKKIEKLILKSAECGLQW